MADFEFEMQIEEVGGDIELSLATGADIQKTRRDSQTGTPGDTRSRTQRIKGEKATRHQPNHKHVDVVGPHVTMILLKKGNDTDTVIFKSGPNKPFVVDIAYDEGFLPPGNPAPPRSPFKNMVTDLPFTTPQASAEFTTLGKPYTGSHVVIARFNADDGAVAHGFYKCTIWMNNNVLDPDFFCDR